jgi:polysaccharide export outer membrane protein
VFNEESLSGEFFVSSAGKVSFPLIGELDASGVGVEEFRNALQAKLSAGYLKDPRVSVEVLTYRPFYILGEVMKPGEYPYSSGMSLLKAVATAGGFTYRAQTKHLFVRHLNESKEQDVTLSTDTPVLPGDTIRVSERFF